MSDIENEFESDFDANDEDVVDAKEEEEFEVDTDNDEEMPQVTVEGVVTDLESRFGNVYVFYDVESTSNDPVEDDIISIGAVAAHFEGKSFNKMSDFHTLIDTSRKIDPAAEAVHHITKAMLRGAPKFKEGIKLFTDWIASITTPTSRVILLAHNGSKFDDIIMFCNLVNIGVNYDDFLKEIKCYGFIDTLKLLRGLFKNKDKKEQPTNPETSKVSFTLGACYSNFCGKSTLEGAHDALVDSTALYDILCSPAVSTMCDTMTLFKYLLPKEKAVKATRQAAGMSFLRKEELGEKNAQIGEQSSSSSSSVSDSTTSLNPIFDAKDREESVLCKNCIRMVDRTDHTSCE
jgi:DNA polymerase III epsilon subunit-like protein